jgi:predicted O-methyltransferase YrrM
METLTRYLDDAYGRGSVSDAAGTPVELAPHSIEREKGEALRDLAIAEGAERTIEVGLALGMSALFLCQAVLPRGGRHVAIDPFQSESWNGAGVRTLREAGVDQLVGIDLVVRLDHAPDERGEKVSRLRQIVEWLGSDFDGVIIFDESHAMQNAAGGSGQSATSTTSQPQGDQP